MRHLSSLLTWITYTQTISLGARAQEQIPSGGAAQKVQDLIKNNKVQICELQIQICELYLGMRTICYLHPELMLCPSLPHPLSLARALSRSPALSPLQSLLSLFFPPLSLSLSLSLSRSLALSLSLFSKSLRATAPSAKIPRLSSIRYFVEYARSLTLPLTHNHTH